MATDVRTPAQVDTEYIAAVVRHYPCSCDDRGIGMCSQQRELYTRWARDWLAACARKWAGR